MNNHEFIEEFAEKSGMSRVLFATSVLLVSLFAGALVRPPLVRAKDSIDAAQEAQQTVIFYSGSFDPPTVGHKTVVENALEKLGADRIIVKVNVSGPKDYHTGLHERAEMLRAMFADNPKVEILENYDPGSVEVPGAKLLHLMGEDSWQRLADEKIKPYGEVVVVIRPGQHADPKTLKRVRVVDLDQPEVSSTLARKEIAQKKFNPKLLDPRVIEFIQSHDLYIAPKGNALKRREASYNSAFNRFIKTAEILSGKKVSRANPPKFSPDQSGEAWKVKFRNWLRGREGGEELANLITDHWREEKFPGDQYQEFIHNESLNSYVPKTDVQAEFRPAQDRIFDVFYVDVPEKELNIVDSGMGSNGIRDQFFVKKDGKKYIRFYIHPNSEDLYKPLIQKYGYTGILHSSPTASTRVVLGWNRGPPIMPKLSLAKKQDTLGRIIPGWEIRRSVGVTALAAKTPEKIWLKNGDATIIPEIAGAYTHKEQNMGSYIDSKQRKVYEHGLIIRDPSFLEDYKKYEIIPLFGLFSEREGKDPLIVELFKASGRRDFSLFVRDYLIRPFMEKNSYLLFKQGIIPEIHGQNVLLALDPKTGEIVHFFHRDVGSMKVDLRLRWAQGLGMHPLMNTEDVASDFKYERATEATEYYFLTYFYDSLFVTDYKEGLKKSLPNYDQRKIRKILLEELQAEAARALPVRSKKNFRHISDRIRAYYAENPPKPKVIDADPRLVESFLKQRIRAKQTMTLPQKWQASLGVTQSKPVVTEYGIAYLDDMGSLHLAFHASPDLKEIGAVKPDQATCIQEGLRSGL